MTKHGLHFAAPQDYQIRLRGSYSLSTGRVEVFFNEEWGTVCDTAWDVSDASVVCRQLGFNRAVRPLLGDEVPNGEGRVWLDYLLCNGNEDNIHDCPHSGFGEILGRCADHSQDAGVVCSSECEMNQH